MPEFSIRTEEYWLHRVDYVVPAATLEEAMQQIIKGEVEYSGACVIEGADEVQRVCSVNGKELPESETNKLLAQHIARRNWQQNNI
jgi:hypothetical protein